MILNIKSRTNLKTHTVVSRPVTFHWFADNFGQDILSVQISASVYADLRAFSRDHLDLISQPNLTEYEKIGSTVFAYLLGIAIKVAKRQKNHLFIATFENKKTRILCEFNGWSNGFNCNCKDCIVREIHES
jgi:hypothetical protein